MVERFTDLVVLVPSFVDLDMVVDSSVTGVVASKQILLKNQKIEFKI